MSKQSFFTLPQLVTRWGCCHSSVLTLARSGELGAVDISTAPGGRSHYIVPAEALEEFESRRTVKPPAAPAKRRAKVKRQDIIEFIT